MKIEKQKLCVTTYVCRKDFFSVSLEKQTTIKAEGNVSSLDLTEAVKETAKTLALEKKIEANQLKRIETAEISKPLFQRFSIAALSVLLISLVGGGFWLWQNSGSGNRAKLPAESEAMRLFRPMETGFHLFVTKPKTMRRN